MEIPGEAVRRGERRRFAKVQANGLLALQLDDDAVVDGEPIHARHQQLTGEQAALVDQALVGVLGGGVVPACQVRVQATR